MSNPEQLAFIESPLTDGVLIGIPGGGKTRSILERILHLRRESKIPLENGFMVLTFSRAACADFLRKGAEVSEREHETRGIFGRDNVRTIHSLAQTVFRSLVGQGQECVRSTSMETIVLRATRELCKWSGSKTELAKKVKILRNVSIIFVDEAQDLNKNQYSFACALRDALGAPLVLIGDPNQTIYQFQGSSCDHLLNHGGFRICLRDNYRSSQAIVDLIERVKPWKDGAPMKAARKMTGKGKRPVLVTAPKMEDISAAILDRVRKKLPGETMAVIGPVRQSKPQPDGTVLNIGLQWVSNLFQKNGIAFQVHFKEDGSDGDRGIGASSGAAGAAAEAERTQKIHLYTLHGSKGLEFDTVLVLNFHHATMGRKPRTRPEWTQLCYLWYVGLSRAREDMILFRLDKCPIWQGFFEFQDLVDVVHCGKVKPIEQLTLSFEDSVQEVPIHWAWTNLLGDRLIVSEENIAALEDITDIQLRKSQSVYKDTTVLPSLPEWEAFSGLYGKWAEAVFQHRYAGGEPYCLRKIRGMLENHVPVPNEYGVLIPYIYSSLATNRAESLCWGDIRRVMESHIIALQEDHKGTNKSKFDNLMLGLWKYLQTVFQPRSADTPVFLWCENPCQWFEIGTLRVWLDHWLGKCGENAGLSSRDIWRMCLFLWQFENEARYRMEGLGVGAFNEHLTALEPYYERICAWSVTMPVGLQFEVPGTLAGTSIIGKADIISTSDHRVIELKFTNEVTSQHALQAIGYTEMACGRHAQDWSTEIFNLRTGDIWSVDRKLDGESRWAFYAQLAGCLAPITKNHLLQRVFVCETIKKDDEMDIHIEDMETGTVPWSGKVGRSEDALAKVRDTLDSCTAPVFFMSDKHCPEWLSVNPWVARHALSNGLGMLSALHWESDEEQQWEWLRCLWEDVTKLREKQVCVTETVSEVTLPVRRVVTKAHRMLDILDHLPISASDLIQMHMVRGER